MRVRASNDGISVAIVAGTEAVLIGIDIVELKRPGLLGFSIWKKKASGRDFEPLLGSRHFRAVPPPEHGGVPLSDGPIQDFLWGDYVVDAGTDYVYRVATTYGRPGAPEHHDELEIAVRTENPDEGRHGIYFNRGVGASQAYSRKFGQYARQYQVEEFGRTVWRTFIRPELVPGDEAFAWLSRGLHEAMENFVRRATHREKDGPEPRYSLRASVYEFTYAPIIRAFVDVLESGADVKIVHHAPEVDVQVVGKNPRASTVVSFSGEPAQAPVEYHKTEVRSVGTPDDITTAALAAVAATGVSDEASRRGFEEMLIPRRNTGDIQHNKFIVLLDGGVPIEVWTGSTNLTAGGIFGQSNVGHVVRDPAVAGHYLEYWQQLAADPPLEAPKGQPAEGGFAQWNAARFPDPQGPAEPNSTRVIFSPRPTQKALEWYAEQMGQARQSVHFTTAFTVAAPILAKALVPPPDGLLRYLLMEGIGGSLHDPYEKMKAIPANRIAWGDALAAVAAPAPGDSPMALAEALTGLNDHVNYLHTKYLLVDPLGGDPLVINGSANFSKNSTLTNDENMIICKGDRRLADIFLSEFMRLFRHFEGRNQWNAMTSQQQRDSQFLAEDESWSKAAFTAGTLEFAERVLFANTDVG